MLKMVSSVAGVSLKGTPYGKTVRFAFSPTAASLRVELEHSEGDGD